MFGLAIGNATAVLTAQAIGAGNPREARHTGLTSIGIMFAISAWAGVVIFLTSHQIVFLYSRDPAVQAIAIPLLAYIAFFQLFDTSQVVIVNALRGYKIAFIPMLVYTAALWGIGLGGGYALGLERIEAATALGLATPMGAAGFSLPGGASPVPPPSLPLSHFTPPHPR